MEKFEESLQDAESAHKLDKYWDKAQYRKGIALKGLKRYNEAIEAFKLAIKFARKNEELASKEIKDCQALLAQQSATN